MVLYNDREMMGPLFHGCYDLDTLKTLRELGVVSLAFDLRARSPNLVPLSDLKDLISSRTDQTLILTFQDDKISTILSFVDLLKADSNNILLHFRDQQDVSYYHRVALPFLWMFHPEADWQNILLLPNLRGVLLPLQWKKEYQKLSLLWQMIEQRNLDVFIHASSLSEANEVEIFPGMKLSVELTTEVESRYRSVDQKLLKSMKLWRKLNESSVIQR